MIINHNMSSINADRVLNFKSKQVDKSMEKLASGLRINRAGDDASGLAVSEKLRSQVRGLNQAQKKTLRMLFLLYRLQKDIWKKQQTFYRD